VPVDKASAVHKSVLSVKPAGVIVTALKPSEDGKARVVRLYNASGGPAKAKITWARPEPKAVWLSNLDEEQISRQDGPVEMAPYEFVTLRVPLSK